MIKACEKRPVSMQMLEKVVEDILQELENGYEKEIPAHLIGAKAMDHLHLLG